MIVLINVRGVCNTMLTYELPRFRLAVPKPLCSEIDVLYITSQSNETERNAGIYAFNIKTKTMSKLHDYFHADLRVKYHDNIMNEKKIVIYGGFHNVYVTYNKHSKTLVVGKNGLFHNGNSETHSSMTSNNQYIVVVRNGHKWMQYKYNIFEDKCIKMQPDFTEIINVEFFKLLSVNSTIFMFAHEQKVIYFYNNILQKWMIKKNLQLPFKADIDDFDVIKIRTNIILIYNFYTQKLYVSDILFNKCLQINKKIPFHFNRYINNGYVIKTSNDEIHFMDWRFGRAYVTSNAQNELIPDILMACYIRRNELLAHGYVRLKIEVFGFVIPICLKQTIIKYAFWI